MKHHPVIYHPVISSFQSCAISPDFGCFWCQWKAEFLIFLLYNIRCAVMLCKCLTSFSYGLEILAFKAEMETSHLPFYACRTGKFGVAYIFPIR